MRLTIQIEREINVALLLEELQPVASEVLVNLANREITLITDQPGAAVTASTMGPETERAAGPGRNSPNRTAPAATRTTARRPTTSQGFSRTGDLADSRHFTLSASDARGGPRGAWLVPADGDIRCPRKDLACPRSMSP